MREIGGDQLTLFVECKYTRRCPEGHDDGSGRAGGKINDEATAAAARNRLGHPSLLCRHCNLNTTGRKVTLEGPDGHYCAS